MIRVKQLGDGGFDYKTEAARRSHNSDWNYVLVEFGPGGVNALTTPFGSRELLEEAYYEAVEDDSITYVAAFDKTEDDLIPVLSATDEGVIPTKVFSKVRGAARTYPKWIFGVLAVAGGLLAVGTLRNRMSKTAAAPAPTGVSGLAGYRVSFRHRKLKGSQSLCIEAPTKKDAIEWAKNMARGAKITRVSKSCGRR